MKLTLCVLLSLILCSKIFSQCNSVFFRNTGVSISDIAVLDTNRIIAVGDNGTIIKSVDAGKSWVDQPKVTDSYYLRRIQMVTDSVGYTVGAFKAILKTEDGGENWFPLYAQIPESFSYNSMSYGDLFFFDKNKGFIIGTGNSVGMLLSTTDGGHTWKDTTVASSSSINSIAFVNDSTGFICGNSSGLYKTIDGGRSWHKITLGFLTQFETLLRVKFINNTTGFILGYNGLCLKTTDRGNTWTKVNTPGGSIYTDVFFLNDLHGIIVGEYSVGLILKTTDGGNSWNLSYDHPGRFANYNCIEADPGKKKIFIAGGGGNGFVGYGGRNILSTADGGATFDILSNNGRLTYYDAFFLNDSTGYIAGEEGSAFRTDDFGESWKPLTQIPALIGGNPAQRIFFVDSLHGFAISDAFCKTNDGGKTWTLFPGSIYSPRKIHFYDTLKGLYLVNDGVYKTINGGANWQNVTSSSEDQSFTDMTIKGGKIFTVGYEGLAQISENEGASWQPLNIPPRYFTSVDFYNDSIGYIGTLNGFLYKTMNAGNTWIEISVPTNNISIRSVRFLNELTGFMSCDGSIYKTNDGGLTWFFLQSPGESVSRLSGFKTLYLAGGRGLILKTDQLKKPGLPGYIYGPGQACVNSMSVFNTGSMPGVNYHWSLSGGGVQKPNISQDSVTWNATGLHTISLAVSNACGVSATRMITTDVRSFQPTITVEDSILTATEGLSYQWFRSGFFIPALQGGTQRSITGKASASYQVEVKGFYGCTKTTPAIFYGGPVKFLCAGGSTTIPSFIADNSYQWQMDTGNGYISMSDNHYISGSGDSLLHLNGIPAEWYGYKFRCVTSKGTSYVTTIRFANQWNGTMDNAWENPANWSCNQVPDANTDVIINSGSIDINSDVTIRKFTLNAPANLAVQPGKTLTITH